MSPAGRVAPLPEMAPLPLSTLVDNIGEKSGITVGAHWSLDLRLDPHRRWRRLLPPRGPEGSRAAQGRVLEIEPGCEADLDAVEEASVDTVVSTFALCRVVDLHGTLAGVRRALAPDGVLLFLEHAGATGGRQGLQRAVTPAWQRLAPGCHLDRDVPAAIRAAGIAITDIERFALQWGGPLMVKGVRGAARPRARREPNDDRDNHD